MNEEDEIDDRFPHTYGIQRKHNISKERFHKILCDQNHHIEYLKIKLAGWKAKAVAREKEKNELQELVKIMNQNCTYLQQKLNQLSSQLKAKEEIPIDPEVIGKYWEAEKNYTAESKLNDPMIILAEWRPQLGSKLNPRKI